MIQDVAKNTTPDVYVASQGARLLATFPPGTLAFGHASGWNNLDPVHGRFGLSHSWSTSGSWILPPRLGRPGVLPRHDTICNHHAVRLLLFDPVGSIRTVKPSRLQALLYCTVAMGGHGHADSHLHTISCRWPDEQSPSNLSWDKMPGPGCTSLLLPWSIHQEKCAHMI